MQSALSRCSFRVSAALFAVVALLAGPQGVFAQTGPVYPDMEEEITAGLGVLAGAVGLIVTAAITYKVIKLAIRWFSRAAG